MKSESIGKLALALSKAQSKISGAVKDSNNPFFKSKYAQLDSVMDAIREPFAENELSLTQVVDDREGKLVLITFLLHSSGEYMKSVYPLVCKDMSNPQALKSLITYARRTSASAIAGVAETDDDGEAANERIHEEKPVEKKPLVNHAPVIHSKTDTDKGADWVKEGRAVTDAQLKRLYAIQQKSKVTPEQISQMIKLRFNKSSSKDLSMTEYDEVVSTLEASIEV